MSLGFFDDALSVEGKRGMLHCMSSCTDSHTPYKRSLAAAGKTKLSDFVTSSNQLLFSILGLSCDFFEADPSIWEARADNQAAKATVDSLKVVNDTAERAMALVRDFKASLT